MFLVNFIIFLPQVVVEIILFGCRNWTVCLRLWDLFLLYKSKSYLLFCLSIVFIFYCKKFLTTISGLLLGLNRMHANRLTQFNFQLEIVGFTSTVLYLGYTALMSITFGIFTGSVGFFASFLFVRYVYSAVKID